MRTKAKVAAVQEELERKIIYFSISSRLFILLLSFLSDVGITDHDAGVFLSPKPLMTASSADRVVNASLGGLVRWDAQYFMHIAHYGYTYENTLAFFPLFPLLTRVLASILDAVLGSIFNTYSTTLLSAIIVNLFFFVNAARNLFVLSIKILQNNELAYVSTLFFCINPGSIFFTAPYSESCFAFFAFSAMLYCINNDNGLLSSFASGLSSCTRSNGLINFGLIAHKCLKVIFASIFRSNSGNSFWFVWQQICLLVIYAFLSVLPFIMFQTYAYSRFCTGHKVNIPEFLQTFGESNGFVTPNSGHPPWCDYTIPLSYSYVQNHYWNVGFLKYYEPKQIPNFLLALPIIILILSNSYLFLQENKKSLISLGFSNVENVMFRGNKLRPEFFVFVMQSLVLTTFCGMFIHIQVITRMLASSCPVLYWFVALRYKMERHSSDTVILKRLNTLNKPPRYTLLESQTNMDSFFRTCIITEKPANRWSRIVLVYFISYSIIGTISFCNYYPWT